MAPKALSSSSADGPYQGPGNAGWLWIKFKREYQKQLEVPFDLVVVGALHGKGDRRRMYGSLLVASFDPATNKYYTLTKVGAGFSDKVLRSLPEILKPYVIKDKHRLVDTRMAAVVVRPLQVIEVAEADLPVSPVHTVAHGLIKRGGLALRFPPDLFGFATIRRRNKRQVCGRSTICIGPQCR